MKRNPVDFRNDFEFESGMDDRSLDRERSFDHAPEEPLVEAHEPTKTTTKPNAKTLKKAGSAGGKRIAGRSDPMQDKVVLNELKQPLPHEDDVEFPYEAHVVTKRDPLRLRASASLNATILQLMPRGHAVTITGRSQNHFRPVSYQLSPDKPVVKGWAFTAYLSPPLHMSHSAKVNGGVVKQPSTEHHEMPTADLEQTLPEHHEMPLLPLPHLSPIGGAPIQVAPIAKPELAVTDHTIASKVTGDMKSLNGPTVSLSSGLHYKDRYQHELEAAGRGGEWKDAWEMGHTASTLWKQPYEINEPMAWQLRDGVSASEALRQWLAGLTIADCSSAMVAIELDAVRSAVGDTVFDRCFGSVSARGRVQKLKIAQRISETPLFGLMRYTEAASATDKTGGSLGKRPVKPGEWYYFNNVPDYLLKHPGGAWRGENALFLGEVNGKQRWSGLGATYDEEGMLKALVDQYNLPRDAKDFSWLNAHFTMHGNWPREYRDGFAAIDPGVSPILNDGPKDQLKLEDVLAAQSPLPADDHGKHHQAKAPPADDRKLASAGIQLSSGMVLSTAKLIELAMKYGDPDAQPFTGPDKAIDASNNVA